MPVIWNPTEEKVVTQMQGAWFTFNPNAMKIMDENKCGFVRSNRKHLGLVVLPDSFDKSSENYQDGFEKTDEGQAILLEKRNEGISNLIEYHIDIIKNNQVSLRNDLAHKYPSADVAKLAGLNASSGELNSMRLVAKYQGKNNDNAAQRLEEVTQLMEKIGPFTS